MFDSARCSSASLRSPVRRQWLEICLKQSVIVYSTVDALLVYTMCVRVCVCASNARSRLTALFNARNALPYILR